MGLFDRLTRLFGKGKPRSDALPLPEADGAEVPDSASAALSDDSSRAPASRPLGGRERRQYDRAPIAGGVRVLVVDDSPTIVLMLRRMLVQNGYEVSEASDAETGLEIARNTLPHLVFLDIVLPGMNGFEALRRLRRDPVTRGIPVVMISGNELATEQFYAQRIGADDFMKKPFSRSEVFMRIEKMLGPDRIPHRQVVPAG
jgi:twitching motility two-component system response regulator PilH